MRRRLASLLVIMAVLLPGSGWTTLAAPAAGAGDHACCLKMQRAAATCHTQAFTCCPSPDRGRQTTTPAGSTVTTAPLKCLDGVFAVAVHDSSALVIAIDAHAAARANAPPAPLYLKHSTFLV